VGFNHLQYNFHHIDGSPSETDVTELYTSVLC